MNADQLKERLSQAYPGGTVEVLDLTGTQDHYHVSVTSYLFSGLTRVQCHQHVMKVVEPELKSGEVHALTITTSVPN